MRIIREKVNTILLVNINLVAIFKHIDKGNGNFLSYKKTDSRFYDSEKFNVILFSYELLLFFI